MNIDCRISHTPERKLAEAGLLSAFRPGIVQIISRTAALTLSGSASVDAQSTSPIGVSTVMRVAVMLPTTSTITFPEGSY